MQYFLESYELDLTKVNIKKWRKIMYTALRLKRKQQKRIKKKNLYKSGMSLTQTNALSTFMQLLNVNKENIKFLFNLQQNWYYVQRNLYLGNLIQTPVYFKTLNSRNTIPKTLLAYMAHMVTALRWKKFYIMHGNEIIDVLLVSLWLRNLTLFMKWMRQYFEKHNLKKHRKLFILLEILLGKLIWTQNMFINLRGVRVSLRGKFGKAGSVRKVRRYIKRGKCSYSSKNIAMTEQSNVIRTITGVFAIKMEIFF